MSNGGGESSKQSYHRLLIGFNHHAECRKVLNFAAHVAQAAGAELSGVFVEDQDLLDLARLPFTTEILSASGVIRNFDSHRAESDLRAIAKGMHDALRKLAGEVKKHYSFRTIRGHLLHDLIALGGKEDLILFQNDTYLWPGHAPRRRTSPGPVLLLQSPGKGGGTDRLLALAREIARSMHLEVHILENYSGPESLLNVKASLIIAPLTLFNSGEDMDRFAAAAPAPVLMVPSTEASSHPHQ